MNIGLYTDSVADLSLAAMLDLAVELGVETLEIGTGGQSSSPHADLPRFLADDVACQTWYETITEPGLRIEALNCSAFPLHPTLGPSHQQLFKDTAQLAERIGVDTIICQSGCPGDSDQARIPNWIVYRWPPVIQDVLAWQWERAIVVWRRLAQVAQDHGVTKICLELHPFNLVYNAPTLLRLREAVGPVIGANYDPSHLMWQSADIEGNLRALGPAVHHVHLKDTRVHAGPTGLGGILDITERDLAVDRPWAFRTIGYGHDALWWRNFLDTLRVIGYDGPLSIEHEDELLPGPIGVRQGVAFLRPLL